MDNPLHYYYGLCILDILDNEVDPSTPRTELLKSILVARTHSMVMSTQPSPIELGKYMRLVNEYLGAIDYDDHATNLWEYVRTLYEVADTHLKQRETGGPFTFQPEEFNAAFLSLIPGDE